MTKKNQIILEFPSEEYVEDFAAWFCDGGGESAYFDGTQVEEDNLSPVISCDYKIRKIIFQTKEMREKQLKKQKKNK